MHIKTLIVRGFKSYKDEIVLGPFSPGHNVIVGRNGSGKSNLFKAISFVLSDEFSKLGQMERTALLYNEGQGDMTAFVEIVLDNTGGRQFPIDAEEVRIRRTIGMKKDEYFLDSKLVKKSDITALLESAGFSKSNPYNIVQQGKIQQLSEMNDSKRLILLKELAGAHVYDERRKESLRIMEESDDKLRQVSEMLQFIEKRLEELESEKEELKEYLELDKQRRSLEYSINKKTLDKRQSQVAKIEKEREFAKRQLSEKNEGIKGEEDRKKQAAEELKAIEQEQSLLLDTLQAQKAQLTQLMEQKTELELDVKQCKENAARRERRHKDLSSKKAEVNTTIQKLEKRIKKLAPEIGSTETEERALLQQHRECKREYEALVVKQGRHHQFKNKKERDAWIQNSIRELEAEKRSEEGRVAQLTGELERLQATQTEKQQELAAKTQESSQFGKREQALINEIGEITAKWSKQRDVLNEQRRSLSETTAGLKTHSANLDDAKSRLLRALPVNISKGLQYLDQMPEKPRGFFGPLVDLFTCDKAFFSAVQAIAGNQLFSVVVDSHRTATSLIDKMRSGSEGRITFMPLDKLRPKEADLPADDFVLPLISRLSFDPKFLPAIKQVFGRALLCRDNETARRYRAEYKVDCVTLDGEFTNRRGPITGGYVNEDEGRLKLQSMVTTSRQLLSDFAAKEEKLRTLEAKAEQELAMLENEKQTKTGIKAAMGKDYGHLRSQIQHLREETNALAEDLTNQTVGLQFRKDRIEELASKIAANKKEMKEDLVITLSASETARLGQLNAQDTELSLRCHEISSKLATLKDELSSSERELQQLKTQQEDVEKELNAAEAVERVELQQKEQQIKNLSKREAEVRKAFDESEENNRKIETKKKKQKDEFENCKKRLDAAHAEIKEYRATSDRLHDQLSQISAEQQELREKLRQLGTISESALRESEESVSAMKTKLVRVNDSLKKFQHVNKKAMDQFTSFTQQRDEHTKRREVMEKSAKSIRDLIDNLDHQKDNAIDTSFKMVVKNFQDVFKAIVRKGRGTLIMKRGQKAPDGEKGAAAAAAAKKIEYTGIGIKVCFDGVNDVTSMTSLSGGQKTVVALALIFAIQKMDPAPFYLFDEVDAALDPIYRSAIANMISSQAGSGSEAAGEGSNKAQFICTTFQRELLDKASQIWFVSMGANKQSRVERTAREEAHRIILDASKESIVEEE